jgi:hypothetical protein
MRSERLTRKSHFQRIKDHNRDDVTLLCGAGRDAIIPTLDTTDGAGFFQSWALSDLLADAAQCDPLDPRAKPEAVGDYYDVLLWCSRVIADSPTAVALMRDADLEGWSIAFDSLNHEGFYLDTHERLITLDHFGLVPAALGRSAYFRNILLTTFIRALRDVWHENRLPESLDHLAPEDILMLERVRAADGDTVAILCGWELRAAGYSDVWRYYLGAEEGDMAIVFSRFLDRDPGALFNGAAPAYAFRQWYADAARVDSVDHATLEMLDDSLMTQGARSAFGSDHVDAAFLESLSLLPDGTHYLSGLGATIMRDPFFSGLNDPINQTHLFHMLYDTEVVMVNNVPFRDAALARKIFPNGDSIRVRG